MVGAPGMVGIRGEDEGLRECLRGIFFLSLFCCEGGEGRKIKDIPSIVITVKPYLKITDGICFNTYFTFS